MSDIKGLTDEYIMHSYGRFPLTVVSGSGSTLTSDTGKKYIDFTSGIGVNSLGYNDPQWVKAVSEQAAKLAHISNLFYTEPAAVLAEKFCKASSMSRVFFCNSGAESNECAIKLARKYSFDKYGAGRYKIITLKNSFHGRTMATITATGQDVFHQYFDPFLEGFEYADANDTDELKKLISEGGVCAVMMELIQGEGGVLPLDKDYVKQAFSLCKDNDVLFMTDEVQTGMGRTGTLFLYQQYGIVPDVCTTAKGLGAGLPIGACLCSDALKDVLSPGTHATTFGANPVVCAGANVVLDTLLSQGFLASVTSKGQYIRSQLQNAAVDGPIRGAGLMLGIKPSKMTSAEAAAKCMDAGLLVLTAKDSVRLLPPLSISQSELIAGTEILKKVLEG